MPPVKRILGVTIGQCVHVAGVHGFLRLARECGYETAFLGAAVPVPELVKAAIEQKPDMLAIGYRLTPEVARTLLAELRDAVAAAGMPGIEMVFGGTPPVAEVARQSGLFRAVFSGEEEPDSIVSFLRGIPEQASEKRYPGTLVERIDAFAPYPLLRHHFGLPSLAETLKGAEELASSGMLDVISIGPDQNAQESLFRPDEMKHDQDGAGGVPIRSEQDLLEMYQRTRRGNHPLLRIYSGTRDLVQWGELARRTIHNAWAAIPLFWYSRLDGRSSRPLEQAIAENQQAIQWYGAQNVPVEVNDPHHWSLRDAPDVVAVADAFISAYNARALGVRDYVAQFMWNTPPSISPAMDLAKMLAKMDLLATLEGERFRVIRECRCGLASLSTRLDMAKGQLAASTMLSLALKPHIIHVVGFCEASHAATPAEIVESCVIVKGVLKNALFGMPDMSLDPLVQKRRQQLVNEANVLIDAIRGLGHEFADPLTAPANLALAVKKGLLDAPHLKGTPEGLGHVCTSMRDGACVAVDEQGAVLTEDERVGALLGRRPALPKAI